MYVSPFPVHPSKHLIDSYPVLQVSEGERDFDQWALVNILVLFMRSIERCCGWFATHPVIYIYRISRRQCSQCNCDWPIFMRCRIGLSVGIKVRFHVKRGFVGSSRRGNLKQEKNGAIAKDATENDDSFDLRL